MKIEKINKRIQEKFKKIKLPRVRVGKMALNKNQMESNKWEIPAARTIWEMSCIYYP